MLSILLPYIQCSLYSNNIQVTHYVALESYLHAKKHKYPEKTGRPMTALTFHSSP